MLGLESIGASKVALFTNKFITACLTAVAEVPLITNALSPKGMLSVPETVISTSVLFIEAVDGLKLTFVPKGTFSAENVVVSLKPRKVL